MPFLRRRVVRAPLFEVVGLRRRPLPGVGFTSSNSRLLLMCVIMADQAAGVRRTVVGDGRRAVGSDDVDIKVHQAFAGNVARLDAHPVSRMAYRARESVLLNVASMFAEAGVIHDLPQIVAFGTQSIRATAGAAMGADGGVWKQIGNNLAGSGRRTELITALQDVRKD